MATKNSNLPDPQPNRHHQARRYGFACSNCRRRKARCDGALPACQKCINAHETCSYDKKPSVAFTVTLQHRLKAYESLFDQLRKVKDEERDALLSQRLNTEKPQGGRARAPSPSNANRLAAEDSSSPLSGPLNGPEADENHVPDETSIGTDGQLYFYGKTSLYHIDNQGKSQDGGFSGVEANTPKDSSHDLYSGADQRNEMGAFLSEIAPDLLSDLLDTYWCWPHHLHNVLCKKIFLRDLRSLGAYITPFLLSAVLTQAARYSSRPDAQEVGDYFAKRALQLLISDVDRGSSIPAIQGLLILSSRDCACGRTSQGWLYSGMAFRMARDMGMHVPLNKLGPLSSHFSNEELALRQQVFWSCYTWDKTISLCLGRAPLLKETIELPTVESLLDGNDADCEIWCPVSEGNACPRTMNFLPQRTLSSTRFAAYCKLSVIIFDVLENLYSRPHHAQRDYMLAYLTQTLERLDEWRSRLPDELLVPEDGKTVMCPPLHILLLNLLYYTTAILLCRPYRATSTVAKRRCTEAARMTDFLFTLHVRRFGFRCITWLQTYTMFVACIINVNELKESRGQNGPNTDPNSEQEASARLSFGLEILSQASTTPSAAKCASIISQLLPNPLGAGDYSLQPKPNNNGIPAFETGQASAQRQRSIPSDHVWDASANVAPKIRVPDSSAPMYRSMPQHVLTNPDIPPTRSGPVIATATTGEAMLENAPLQTSLPFGNAQLLNDDLNGMGPNLSRSGVGAPFRWLPENLHDDGSWMLMEFDVNSLPMFDGPR